MRYVVCYDITENSRRSRLATSLLNFGKRIEESVFVADLDEALAARMQENLERQVDEATDKVHIFRLCKECSASTKVYGTAAPVEDREFYVL